MAWGKTTTAAPTVPKAPRVASTQVKGSPTNRVSIAPASPRPPKPSFETVLAAKKGDRIAQAAVAAWGKSNQAAQQAAAQDQAQQDANLFGKAASTVHKSAKVTGLNALGSGVINFVSPVEAAKRAYTEAQHGKLGASALDAASILPIGKGIKAIRALKGAGKVVDEALLATRAEHAASLKGATLHHDLTVDPSQEGYVAAYGAHEHVIPRTATGSDIHAYRNANADKLAADPAHRVGVWEKEGKTYLDVSKRFTSRTQALAFGRKQGQLAVWDAKAGKEIPTGLTEAKANAIKASLKEGLKTPAEHVLAATAGVRSMYGKQKVLRAAELKARSDKISHIFATTKDPEEAHALAAEAMRGELPKIAHNGMKDFTPQLLSELKGIVQNHPTLLNFHKRQLMDALQGAYEGKLPTPSNMRMIEQVFGKKTAQSMFERAQVQDWKTKAINLINIPRSLMATADLSAVLRQGLVGFATHPIITGRSVPSMMKAFVSPHFYDEWMKSVETSPNYHLALAGGVSFSSLGEGASLLSHEEAFASDYAARLWGIGKVVRGSSRAYVGFLNKVRMDLFDNQIRIAQRAGRDVHDEHLLTSIAKVINAATGRGTAGEKAGNLLPAMNAILFSPRLMLSRLNYFNPFWYAHLHPQARIEALKGLLATAGAVSGALFLFSRIPGVKVGSLDPRSPDFGKLKIGNTRLDIAGGFQQYVRLASEIITNTKISSTTGVKTKLGSKYGVATGLDEALNFIINKGAPPTTLAADVLRRRDTVGQPITAWSELKSKLTPLLGQDAADLYHEHHGGMNGIEWAVGGYGVGAFGVGEQTYGPKTTASVQGVSPVSGGGGGGGHPQGGSWGKPGHTNGFGGAPSSSGGSWGKPPRR